MDSLKAIRIDQREEQVEIFFLSVMRRCRKQEEVFCDIESNLPSKKRRVYFTSPPQTVADILCASSQTIKSHSETLSFSCTSSFRASLSSRQIHKSTSLNTFRLQPTQSGHLSEYQNADGISETTHPAIVRQGFRVRQLGTVSGSRGQSFLLMNRPVIIVLPAPGSSASTYLSGRRGSIS